MQGPGLSCVWMCYGSEAGQGIAWKSFTSSSCAPPNRSMGYGSIPLSLGLLEQDIQRGGMGCPSATGG